jgi:hypothetical protein
MILIAILAPVIIVAALLAGTAMLALIMVGVAAVGALVTVCVESIFCRVSKRRAARKLQEGGKATGWPQPTAQSEVVYGDFDRKVEMKGGELLQEFPIEDPVFAGVTEGDSQVACGGGVHSWEEVFPVDEPDFEGPDAYTLIADSADRQ